MEMQQNFYKNETITKEPILTQIYVTVMYEKATVNQTHRCTNE